MRSPGWAQGVLLALAASILAAPSVAWGNSSVEVRFLHAAAGVGPAALVVQVHGGQTRLRSSFAHPSGYERARAGRARVELKVKGRAEAVATRILGLKPGRWTVIAVARGRKADLLVYRDDGATPGRARLRVIHAAAELGGADVRIDGRVVARVGFGDATGYASVPPGLYDLAVTRPSGKGGALVARPQTALAAGSASTAVVVGSAGSPARFVLMSDSVSGPSTAPATGFGGGAGGGGGWLLVVASGLTAGTLGGAAYTRLARWGRRAR